MHTVIARASMASAHGSFMTRIAAIDAIDVRERLAHALEHDAVDRARPGAERRAHEPHLLDDLPDLEVAREPEAAGGAERAGERAARLRADARAEAPRALERDAHRLDDVAVARGQRELDEGVDGAAAGRRAPRAWARGRCARTAAIAGAPDPARRRRRTRRARRGGRRATTLRASATAMPESLGERLGREGLKGEHALRYHAAC